MKTINEFTETELQELGQKLVSQYIYIDASHLVNELHSKLLAGFGDAYEGMPYEENGEETQTDIFEYWIVSPWLADRLAEKNEKIIKALDICFWGRSTTGQAIYLDGVIQEIAFGMWGNR